MRWKLTIEYDGSAFSGWQKQPDAITVQQTLEEAFEKLCKAPVTLHVAGRTDAGVHAHGQVAHVDIIRDADPRMVRDAVNFYLRPHKISILDATQVDEAFHARFSALTRSYRYRIINRRAPLALFNDYVWHIIRPLDVAAMQKAADILLGTHDFSSFRAQHCQSKSPVKTLDGLYLKQEGDEITIYTQARSFLYHQVRNMVGSLSLVGTGRWSVEDFRQAFLAADRTKGGPTAPACGLYFWDVTYPQK